MLLPSSNSKLLGQQGPFRVTKGLGRLTYELYMPDRKKKHQTFHVNLFEFQVPPQQSVQQPPLEQPVKQQFLVHVVKDEEEGEQFFHTNNSEPGSVALSHLQSETFVSRGHQQHSSDSWTRC